MLSIQFQCAITTSMQLSICIFNTKSLGAKVWILQSIGNGETSGSHANLFIKESLWGPISLIRTHPFGKVVHHFPDLIPIQVQALHSAAADWALGLIFPLALLQQYSLCKVSEWHSEIPYRDDWTTSRPDRPSGASLELSYFSVVSALIERAVDHKWWA